MQSLAALLALRPLLQAAVLIAACLAALPVQAESAKPIIVTANGPVIEAYREILARFGNDPLKVTPDLPPGRYDRTVVELVIAVRALRLGGMDRPVAFARVSNCRRAVEEVICGKAAMAGQQLDVSILNGSQSIEDLYLSDFVTPAGEFHKLFYCLPDNKKVLAARSVEDLNNAGRGIIGSSWDNDRQILTDMGVTGLLQAPTFPLLIKMIQAGRADWIPMEASNQPGMERIMGGQRFVPVPGIRFSLIESRHFMVSRIVPDGEAIFAALQKGLRELRRQGFIRAMLEATGFYASDRLGWKTLNQDAVERHFGQSARAQ